MAGLLGGPNRSTSSMPNTSLDKPQRTQLDLDIAIFETIPERVQSLVGLEVKRSDIEGAGRGIFVKEDVKEGQVVFHIKRPLLTIVSLA